MNIEKERKAFEDWLYLGQTEVEPDDLIEQEVNFVWLAWQARANLCTIVPEGFKLVPVEPTDEMHVAARDWSTGKYGKAIGLDASEGCYKAMLAAAPLPDHIPSVGEMAPVTLTPEMITTAKEAKGHADNLAARTAGRER